jgi:hypothetical protein
MDAAGTCQKCLYKKYYVAVKFIGLIMPLQWPFKLSVQRECQRGYSLNFDLSKKYLKVTDDINNVNFFDPLKIVILICPLLRSCYLCDFLIGFCQSYFNIVMYYTARKQPK